MKDNKLVIGVSGKKQSGKTTLIAHIADLCADWEILRMADTLKQIVIDCFIPYELNIRTPDDLEEESVKSIVLPCGKTIRDLLQIIGTDMFRSLWSEVWLNAWLKKVHDSTATLVLCPDIRFPNELETVQKELNGICIRLLRNPFDDQHKSEIALDNYINEFDLVLDNTKMSMEDQKRWTKGFVQDLSL
jgi:hypothetical protein